MANPDHVARLKNSVAEWNSWRESHRDISPELSGADLSGADLSGADLSGADLSQACLSRDNDSNSDSFIRLFVKPDLTVANLSRANLSQAKLLKADLRGVHLTAADLSRAKFDRADLSGANLRGANLSGAELGGAYLQKADLIAADLSGAKLGGTYLVQGNLTTANLSDANFFEANLFAANLSGVFGIGASFCRADLSGADLSGADLRLASLNGTNLSGANLSEADLSGADLIRAVLIETRLTKANLTGCLVYGLSAWDVGLEGTIQTNLVITPKFSPTVTVDNLEVAQFIYLLLNNKNVRHVIDTLTSKVVLILGRFTPERKVILDAMREELRKRDYLPVLFDFEGPSNRDITETVSTLAHMARFVIADITDAKSIPQELMAIVPALPSVPVQPLLLASQQEYGMFEHIRRFPWVLDPFLYEDQDGLIAVLTDKVIDPAEKKAKERTGR